MSERERERERGGGEDISTMSVHGLCAVNSVLVLSTMSVHGLCSVNSVLVISTMSAREKGRERVCFTTAAATV